MSGDLKLDTMLTVAKERDLEIPEIFRGAIDYKDDPVSFELAQKTFNEEGLYRAIASFALDWYKSTGRPAKVLDLCSSTGLCARRVAKTIPVESVTLIDIDQSVLSIGREYFDKICPVHINCLDAVTFQVGGPYDLILMNSAYHHIENDRKVAFFKNAASLLGYCGSILIGEHFLPPYRNPEGYRESVVFFYTKLIQELKKRSESSAVIDMIRMAGLYCWQGVYEYKVSFKIFQSHLMGAGLKVNEFAEVWLPSENKSIHECIGSYCLEIIRDNFKVLKSKNTL